MLENSLAERIEKMTGKKLLSATAVSGGYTSALRLLVQFNDHSRLFAKVATSELTAEWLRQEFNIYSQLKADFLPDLLGWDDDGLFPVLLLQDLSQAHWPRSWDEKKIEAVFQTMESVRSSKTVISGLPTLQSRAHELANWHLLAENPQPFLSLGMCSKKWLELALPVLLEAQQQADLDGDQLIHLDLRSDNLCFVGDAVKLVDWNWACTGNALIDVLFWLPSLALEGGPAPANITRVERDPGLISLITSCWAYRAGQAPPSSGSQVREIQKKQLSLALPWCAEVLDLPPPDGYIAI